MIYQYSIDKKKSYILNEHKNIYRIHKTLKYFHLVPLILVMNLFLYYYGVE